MSLYNMLFGVQPTASIALAVLGLNETQVPRFRDAYFAWDDDSQSEPVIVVYTRTGGGNREHYDAPCEDNPDGPWNCTLQELPGYIRDADDDYDSTYATFHFRVPDDYRAAVVAYLQQNGHPGSSQERWNAVLDAISAHPAADKKP